MATGRCGEMDTRSRWTPTTKLADGGSRHSWILLPTDPVDFLTDPTSRRTLRAMFVEALKDVVENTEGAIAGLLMDVEGIPLEAYVKEGTTAPFDIEVVGAEFSVIVKSVQRTVESLEAGTTREVSVQAERVVTLIRVLNDEYFLALALNPTGSIGKGRYMLRINAPKLLAELS